MRLALVRGNREILEGDGGLQERLLLLGHALEVERRPLDRLRAEQIAKRRYVRALDGAHDAHRARGLAGDLSDPLRLGVEGRLEIFQRERVVENRDIALRHAPRERARPTSSEHRSGAGRGSEEPPPWEPRCRFAQGAVAIELDRG